MTSGLSCATLVRVANGTGASAVKTIGELTTDDILYDAYERKVPILSVSDPVHGPMKRVVYRQFERYQETSFACSSDHPIPFHPPERNPSCTGRTVHWLSHCRRSRSKEEIPDLLLDQIVAQVEIDLGHSTSSVEDYVDELVAHFETGRAEDEDHPLDKYRHLIADYISEQHDDDIFDAKENLAAAIKALVTILPPAANEDMVTPRASIALDLAPHEQAALVALPSQDGSDNDSASDYQPTSSQSSSSADAVVASAASASFSDTSLTLANHEYSDDDMTPDYEPPSSQSSLSTEASMASAASSSPALRCAAEVAVLHRLRETADDDSDDDMSVDFEVPWERSEIQV